MKHKHFRIKQLLKTDFADACAAAARIANDGSIPPERFRREPDQACKFLNSIRDAAWPESDPYHRTLSPKMGLKAAASTMVQYAHDANLLLDQIAERSRSDHKIYIESHSKGLSFSVYWAYRDHGHKENHGCTIYKRIAVLGKFHKDNHSIHFMRGVHSMARELGITVIDRRGEASAREEYHNQGIDRFLNNRGDSLDPRRDSIIMHFEDPDWASILINAFENLGFHIITTGYRAGDITAKHTALAEMLAEQAIRDEREAKHTARRKALVVTFSSKSSGHVYTIRQDAITHLIDKSGCLYSDFLDLKFDPFVEGKLVDAKRKFARQLGEKLGNDVAAIFGRTDQITAEVTDIVARQGLPIKVYTEIMTQGTLLRLADSDNPLYAVCGTDPYFHGRYAVRAAAYRENADVEHKQIEPILITKRVALEQAIFSSDRIPAVFDGRDVQLNQAQYAWPTWMKSRCPCSFGPELFGRPNPG
jgi:hypothetical protein